MSGKGAWHTVCCRASRQSRGLHVSEPLLPRGQVGLGGRSPRPLPFSLVDLVSRRSDPCLSLTPSLWGGEALLSSDEHIHPQTLAHVSVCPGSSLPSDPSAASPVPPAVLQQCVCCRVCLPRKTGPRPSLSLPRLVGWHSLCSVRACEPGLKLGAKCHLL